jgi:hypothetical protein
MKHIKLFESFSDFPNTKEDIRRICRKYGINLFTINDDMSIDVDFDVYLSHKGLNKLPLKFNKVRGSFYCGDNKLTTLEGAPKEVGGCFWCQNNQLITLKESPKKVGGSFWCQKNQLITLEGSPEEVGKEFDCSTNQLTTLKGSPEKVGGEFNCNFNKLTTLEGAPKEVGGGFHCNFNKLTTLEGAPKEVGGGFHCHKNPIYSLFELFGRNYKWLNKSIKEYSWLDGTEIDKMRLIDVFLDLDLPEPDLSEIDKIYTII